MNHSDHSDLLPDTDPGRTLAVAIIAIVTMETDRRRRDALIMALCQEAMRRVVGVQLGRVQ